MKLNKILEFSVNTEFDNFAGEQFNDSSKKFELDFLEAIHVGLVKEKYSYTQNIKIENLIRAGLVFKKEDGSYKITSKGGTWLNGFRDVTRLSGAIG